MTQTQFGEFRMAAKFRDVMRRVARREVDLAIPPDEFGVVDSIDTALELAWILVPGADTPIAIPYTGGTAPELGESVRITGRAGSRYLPGSGGGGTVGVSNESTVIWQKKGELSTFVSTQPFTSIGTTHLDSVICTATDDPPSGSDLIVQLLLNGVTGIFDETPDDHRPTITSLTTVSNLAIPDITTLSNLDFLVPEIVQVGSVTPGTGLIIQLEKH